MSRFGKMKAAAFYTGDVPERGDPFACTLSPEERAAIYFQAYGKDDSVTYRSAVTQGAKYMRLIEEAVAKKRAARRERMAV